MWIWAATSAPELSIMARELWEDQSQDPTLCERGIGFWSVQLDVDPDLDQSRVRFRLAVAELALLALMNVRPSSMIAVDLSGSETRQFLCHPSELLVWIRTRS